MKLKKMLAGVMAMAGPGKIIVPVENPGPIPIRQQAGQGGFAGAALAVDGDDHPAPTFQQPVDPGKNVVALFHYIRFSGFSPLRLGNTNRPSLRINTPSKYISPPPISGVWMHTRSQWMEDLLPLLHSS